MLRKGLIALACASIVLACGGDDDTGDLDDADGGQNDGGQSRDGGVDGAAGDAGKPARLLSGNYTTSDLKLEGQDGCNLGLVQAFADGEFRMHVLANTGGRLTIGNLRDQSSRPAAWNPAGNAFGSAPYESATTATLLLDTKQSFPDEDDCVHRLKRTTQVRVVADNTLELDMLHEESEFDAQCGSLYPKPSCTSRFTFKLTMAQQ